MNTRLILLTVAASCLTANCLFAQAKEEKLVTIEVKGMTPQEQKTPQYQATGVKDKTWRQKSWLEIDLAMDVKKKKTAEDATTLVDSLEVKYFIALNATDPNKKYYLLQGTMILQNVPTKVGEHAHALAYVSPSTLRRLLGENKQLSVGSDIKAMAVEINHQGQLVGGHTTIPGKWWENPASFSIVDGSILAKSKTPFAPLWGDYDVDVKQQ